MSEIFNVTGSCKSKIHYMVDLKERLIKIKEMVDRGDYFTINRARQYGKTTTLRELCHFLREDYLSYTRRGATVRLSGLLSLEKGIYAQL